MTLQLRVAEGLIAGLVAAAATTGALLVFGRSLGDPLQAFQHIGVPLVGSGAPALAAAAGLVVHLAAMLVWGLVAGLLAPRSKGLLPVLITAVLVTLAAVLVHGYVALPELQLGAGLGGPRAPSGPVVALHLLFAGSLVLGLMVTRRR